MINLKRGTCLLLTGVIAFSVAVSGCGKNNDSASTQAKESNTVEEVKTQEQKSLEPVKLTLYSLIPEQQDQNEVFTAANKIIKEKINAEVEFNFVGPGAYDDKMKLMAASGEEFDVCFTSDWKNNYYQNVAKGAFLALDDILSENAPTLVKDVPQMFWEATKVNGKIYGIPNQQITARSSSVWFQKELLDGTGTKLEDIKTLDDVEAYTKKAKEQFGKIAQFPNFNYEQYYYGLQFIIDPKLPGAIRVKDNSAKVFNQFESEEWLEHLNRAVDYEAKGYYNKEFILPNTDIDATKTKAKDYSWGWEGTFKPGGDAECTARYGWTYVCKQMSEPILSTSGVVASLQAVGRTSKNPERAVMLIDLLNTDKVLYNTIVFGLDGKHFKKLGENRIELIPDSGYNTGRPWAVASTFNAYLLPGQPDNVWEQTKQINNNALVSPILGFVFDSTPVNVELSNCSNVYKEYEFINSGKVDLDKTQKEFLSKLKDAGVDKIIAEEQKQINAFLANKK